MRRAGKLILLAFLRHVCADLDGSNAGNVSMAMRGFCGGACRSCLFSFFCTYYIVDGPYMQKPSWNSWLYKYN